MSGDSGDSIPSLFSLFATFVKIHRYDWIALFHAEGQRNYSHLPKNHSHTFKRYELISELTIITSLFILIFS